MHHLPPREFVRAVRDYVAEHELLRAGQRVVVGVSGGPDSMALLHALHELTPALRLRLHVAHLDHGLRAGSARDAAFVTGAAGTLSLPCSISRVPVSRMARQRGLSLEDAGRWARYRFFSALAGRLGATRVAVGHHADDQAETVLMRLLRGAAAGGLAGMAPGRTLTGAVRLVRPLLALRRAEIEGYLRWRRVAVRRDPSNASRAHARNAIRHDLLPLLERRYNPAIREALTRTAQVLAEENGYLDGLADRALRRVTRRARGGWRGSVVALRGIPLAVRRRVLRLAALRGGTDPRRLTQAHLDALIRLVSAGAGRTDLPAARAVSRGGALTITRGGSLLP